MRLKAPALRTTLSKVLALVAVAVVLDLLITAAVFVDRRDDPQVPDFRVADVSTVTWGVSPYRTAPRQLGFSLDRTLRPTADAGKNFAPDLHAAYVIATLARFESTDDQRWLRTARRSVQRLLRETEAGLVPHRNVTTDLLGTPVEPPWYAADTQGRVLSALARLAEVTGEQRWRDRADEIFGALLSFQGFFAGEQPAPRQWMSSVDADGYVWFDRFSTDLSSSKVLSEQLWTMLGIYDYRRILADRPTEKGLSSRLFAGSLATVEKYLPSWRVPGRIAISGLSADNRDVREHFVAIEQLKIVASITSSPTAARAAADLGRDTNVPFFPTKTFDTQPDVDVFVPLPAELRELARLDDPPRVTATGRSTSVGGVLDPGKAASYALALVADPASTPADVDKAGRVAELIVSAATDGAVPHRYATKAPDGESVRPPWYSSATQGTLLSVFTRLHQRTAQERWLALADDVFGGLTRVRDYGVPNDRPWLALVDFSGYLWFDRNLVTQPPFRSLREHLAAVIGIYDYWRLTSDGIAYAYFAGGVASMREVLPLIRRPGEPAVETLDVGVGDRRQHVALTQQIAAIAAITGDTTFARIARLLGQDFP